MARRYFTLIVTVGLACMLLMVTGPLFGGTAAAAGLDKGLYLLDNKTYYTNPDTGKVDDGGDTSIGNGMSRNVTYSKSLLEIRDGRYLVTLRMKMISYISKVTIHVQKSKGDGAAYSPVTFKITGENKAENTRDYQFEVSDPTLFIKPVIYVEPMGRDVVYFVSLLEDSAQPDRGSFQAYNQTGGQQQSAAQPELPQGVSMESSDNPVHDDKSTTSTPSSASSTKSANNGTSQGSSSSDHKTDKTDKIVKNNKAGQTDGAGEASSKQKQSATPALPDNVKQDTASQANKEKQAVPTASTSGPTSDAEAQDSTGLTTSEALSSAQQASGQQAPEQLTRDGATNPTGEPSSSAEQMDAATKDKTAASELATEGVAAPIATDIIADGADDSDDEVGIVEFDQNGARQNERAASAAEDEGDGSSSLLSMPALLLVLLAVCAAGLYLMKLMKLRKK